MFVKTISLLTFFGYTLTAFASFPATREHRLPRYKYEQVIRHLTPELEARYNVIIFVNTSERQKANQPIPAQHMLVVERLAEGAPMFDRDKDGNINLARDGRLTGINLKYARIFPPDNSERGIGRVLFPELFPVSSGIGPDGSDKLITYSGIFGLNYAFNVGGTGDSNIDWIVGRYGGKDSNEGMAYSSFIDYRYTASNESWARLAIHATPEGQYGHLGIRRASEGCIRTTAKNSRKIQALLRSPENIGLAPRLNLRSQMPYMDLDEKSEPVLEYKQKALIVLFDDYQSI